MVQTVVKQKFRILGWSFVVFTAVNVIAVISPWRVLIYGANREYFVDYDIVYELPEYAALRRPDQQVRHGKVCVYWQGGRSTWPDFLAADAKCAIFKLK